MATPYNHKEIEKKWRHNWDVTPINKTLQNQNIIVLICSLIHQDQDVM